LTLKPTTRSPQPPGWIASATVATLTAAMLATWLPHYLAWPWWPDADAWATMAQGWDSGMRPYRDVTCFNFPGPIYQSWTLGKIFGWGRTWPFYALDAAMLVGLGPLLAVWSRRRFDSALAGLVGWAAVVATYCSLDISLVAQRDWQGPLLVVSALAVVQAWPVRAGLIGSAVLMAVAFAIRPHVVLFLPAIGLAIACDSAGWRDGMKRWGFWGVVFVIGLIVTFLPLIVQGLIDDFIRGVRQASYGSGYGGGKRAGIAAGVLRQLGLVWPATGDNRSAGWTVLATLLGLTTILAISSGERRRLVAPWLASLAVVLLYAPLHPKNHGYLALPLPLVWAVAWGVLAGVVVERAARFRIVALVVFVVVAVPGVPAYCLPGEAIDAVLGRHRSRIPAAARAHFAPQKAGSPYHFGDYRATLEYLRARTTPETKVATILRNVPFPSINGTVGRVSPLPAESGVIWLWSVNPKLEEAFVNAILAAPKGSVVVWSPGEVPFTQDLRLDALCSAIRRGYRPEAKFGMIEIWRKPGL